MNYKCVYILFFDFNFFKTLRLEETPLLLQENSLRELRVSENSVNHIIVIPNLIGNLIKSINLARYRLRLKSGMTVFAYPDTGACYFELRFCRAML